MTAPRWTSGPWTVTDNSWDVSTVYSHDGFGIVARCPIDGGVDEHTQDHLEVQKCANAALIAAAPDLYEALALCTARLEGAREELSILNDELGRSADEENIQADEMERSIAKIARAALAKARGDAP